MKGIRDWLRKPRYSILSVGVLLFLATIIIVFGCSELPSLLLASLTSRRLGARNDRIRLLEQVAFVTPLAKVRLAEMAKESDPNAYQHPYTFTNDWFTTRLASWRIALRPYAGRAGLNYLEIGTFEGRSLFWMLENILTDPTAHATAIDLFDGPYAATYRSNLQASGQEQKVTTLAGYSQVALRGLPVDSYDLVYIDGSHRPADVLEDAVLCWRLLRAGGLMIFDDYANARIGHDYQGNAEPTAEKWYPKMAIDPFVLCHAEECEVIHNDFQLMVRKRR